ncbi:MAG TPA: Uma2 family endonuclease, partial [Urbifossiella sp.]|nr:Uma2 family endonuclease [Urbifossiella sp.]
MTPATAAPMTAEEFFGWANRPENAGRRFELESGRAVEMPSPGEIHAFTCWLAIRLLTEYLTRRGSGYLLTNDCGLVVRQNPDTVRGPDVMAFLEPANRAAMSKSHCQRVPALVVEVLSPSDTMRRTTVRVGQYLTRGVKLIWVADPEERIVYVHRPDEFSKVLDETEELTGNGVLPDFACPVRSLF